MRMRGLALPVAKPFANMPPIDLSGVRDGPSGPSSINGCNDGFSVAEGKLFLG